MDNAYTDPKFTAYLIGVYQRNIKRGDNSPRLALELAAAKAALKEMTR